MNLPIADEVLRARASRTTHPYVLELFSNLYTKIMARPVIVDNPFFLKTKTEVVQTIANHGKANLIPKTCSCSHTWFQTRDQQHCGRCSQCIDRRIATLAAGQQDNDPESDYAVDVFSGPRDDGYDKNIAVNYVRHAVELDRMTDVQFASKFNLEISRAIRAFPNRSQASEEITQMHKRHAKFVMGVLKNKISENSATLLSGSLEDSSMLSQIIGGKHLQSHWQNYSSRLVSLLQIGIPIACEKEKPKDEPALQRICDAILKGHDDQLIREFPFIRWSSVATKPDWSNEALELFIELKYIRTKADIRTISRDIAEDITKYGDGGRRIQFIVYDPHHLITNEKEFSKPILDRENMLIGFIR
jgi:hypothetical protein